MGALQVCVSASAAHRLGAARDRIAACPPASRVLIVGASRGAADDLVRQVALSRPATFGIQRLSLTQLAARSAIVSLAVDGLAPSSWLGIEAVAARAVFDAATHGALGYFAPVADTPGFPRAVAETLQELQLSGVPGARLPGLPRAGGDLAGLLDRFEAVFAEAGSVDRARLFRTAAGVLRQMSVADVVVLLDVPLDHDADRELVAALIDGASETVATVPHGDHMAAAWFESRGAAREAGVPDADGDLDRLRRYLFTSAAPGRERPPDGSLELFSAPGEGRESVEIARRILKEAARGVPFDQMAIFVRSPHSYFGLLEHALRRANVPAWFDRGTRRPHPTGRAFLAVLACAAEHLSAARFAEYLSLAQVPSFALRASEGKPLDALRATEGKPLDALRASEGKPLDSLRATESTSAFAPRASADKPASATVEGGVNGEDPAWAASRDEVFTRAPDSQEDESEVERIGLAEETPSDSDPVIAGTLRAPWRWESLLVEAAVIGGDSQRWRRRLDGKARELSRQIVEVRRDEGGDSSRARALELVQEQLEHLRQFALPIIGELAAWPREGTWGEWLDRFEALAPRVLRTPAFVLRVLADLRPMAAVGPVDLDEARRVLGQRLLTVESEPPARRFGRVFVGTPHHARGRSFRVVFVPGLAERMFPQKPREDPLLLDELREAADDTLPRQRDRLAAERLLLQLAAGAASERLYVSYPRIELSEARARVPSFYALDVMRAVTGRVPDFELLEDKARAAGNATLAWPAPPDPAAAIDDQEHDLAVLRRLLDEPDPEAVRGHAHYLLKLNECLRRSVIDRWARGERRWSKSDGLTGVTPHIEAALRAQRLSERPFSLSTLQRFAACPYQFLLAAVYRLHPLEIPEPVQRLDPLARGSLFHEIQARFFRDLQAAGRLPLTSGGLGEARETLDHAIEVVATKAHDDLAPAVERVWNDEMGAMRRDLHAWLEHLARDGEEWVPKFFEFAFGSVPGERDASSVSSDVLIDGRFRLRGAVDLIEEHRITRLLRVTDHKTGRKPERIDKVIVDGGKVMQPVLYAMAVEIALGQAVRQGRLFYCTSTGSFHQHEIPLNELTRAAGLEVLQVIDRAVETGFLAAAPAADACERCDFRPVCGPDVFRRVARKPQDPLADLFAIRSRP